MYKEILIVKVEQVWSYILNIILQAKQTLECEWIDTSCSSGQSSEERNRVEQGL